jgi:hypothetical protein
MSGRIETAEVPAEVEPWRSHPAESRAATVAVRLSERERSQVEAMAEAADLTMSELIRRAVLS